MKEEIRRTGQYGRKETRCKRREKEGYQQEKKVNQTEHENTREKVEKSGTYKKWKDKEED